MRDAGNARQLRFVKSREWLCLESLLSPCISNLEGNNLNMPKTHKKTKKRKSNHAKKRSASNCYQHKALPTRCGCTQIESDSDSDIDDFLVSMLGDLRMQLKRAVLFYSLLSEAKMPYESAIQKQKQDEIVMKMYAAWMNEDGTFKKCGRCDKCLASSSTQ